MATRINSSSDDEDVAAMTSNMSAMDSGVKLPASQEGKSNKKGNCGNQQAYELLKALNNANETNRLPQISEKYYQQVCNAVDIGPTTSGEELLKRVHVGYEVLLLQLKNHAESTKLAAVEKNVKKDSIELRAATDTADKNMRIMGSAMNEALVGGPKTIDTPGGLVDPMVHGMLMAIYQESIKTPTDQATPFKRLAVDFKSLEMLKDIAGALFAYAETHQKEATLKARLIESNRQLEKIKVQKNRHETMVQVTFHILLLDITIIFFVGVLQRDGAGPREIEG